ncbi:MAG: aminotransferase, partial [Lachnospiraceae bacterium]
MKSYKNMSKEELLALKLELEKAYEDAKGKGLNLNMARGKPSAAQLNTVTPLLSALQEDADAVTESGIDCRNYG